MFKPTYLYVKTHNVTGLKYFGKTISKDPHKYKGSGTYWRRHIEKHGNDVTTEILGFFLIEEECFETAKRFSEENNIVNSVEWANLMNETLTGGFEHINSLDRSKWDYHAIAEKNPATFDKNKKLHARALEASHTKEACDKRLTSTRTNGKSNEFRCWVTDGTNNRFVVKAEVERFLEANSDFRIGKVQKKK